MAQVRRIAIVAGLVAAIILVAVVAGPRQRSLEVAFLDVGQGDATFITTPSRFQVLIDAGPDWGVLAQLANHMPWWDRTIDLVISTHPDKDHIAGLAHVGRYLQVAHNVDPGLDDDTPWYETQKNTFDHSNTAVTIARAGQQIDIGDGIILTVLHPAHGGPFAERNDASVVVRMDYGESSFLFPGDITANVERHLVKTYPDQLDVDVLKLAHHGSKTSTSQEFLDATTPGLAVISTAVDSRYGHPHAEVTDRVAAMGIPITGTHLGGGAVVLQASPTAIWQE